MSELSESLEKSVKYLRERYPLDHPLLVGLEQKLEMLKKNKISSSGEMASTARPFK